MTGSFATWLGPPVLEYREIIRELLSYDAICEKCTPLPYEDNYFSQPLAPSALYWSRQSEWPWALKQLALTGKESVLEVGSGWAVLQYALAKRCYHLVTMDPDPKAAPFSSKVYRKLGLHNYCQINASVESLSDYHLKHHSFDNVVCTSVLEHISGFDRQRQSLHEMIRVLKPGGKLVLTCDVVIGGTADDYHLNYRHAIELLLGIGAKEMSYTSPCMRGEGRNRMSFLVMGLVYIKGANWLPLVDNRLDLFNLPELDQFAAIRRREP